MALKAIESHYRHGLEVETKLAKQTSDTPMVLRYVIEGVLGDIRVKKALSIQAESLLVRSKAERIAQERERVADEVVAIYAAWKDDDDLPEVV